MGDFKCFYDVLQEALKGKKVRLRRYGNNGSLPDDYDCFIHKREKVVDWNNNIQFEEWTGTVKEILHNDNSHVDIIFDDKKTRTRPSKKHYWDCFNWHMGDYIEILN